MHIAIIIPYEPDKKLAYAYNRAANDSLADWILFLDTDLFILNHRFYNICLSAISKVDSTCGWITARTNRLGPSTRIHQLDVNAPKSDDISEHTLYSEKLYSEYGDEVRNITNLSKQIPLSGFFILTPTKVAQSVGFRGEFLGCDNNYCNDLIKLGYSTWIIPGLYFYHQYKRPWKEKK